MRDVEVMDLNIIVRNMLPTHRADLDFRVNIVVVGINYQIIIEIGRIVEVISFATGYESIHQVPAMDAIIRCDDNHT